MNDNVELITVGVIIGVIAAVLGGLLLLAIRRFVPVIANWIAWRWRLCGSSLDQRRDERNQYRNQAVMLTTGEAVHRRCTRKLDEIMEKEFLPLGSCPRCGERWDERRWDGVIR